MKNLPSSTLLSSIVRDAIATERARLNAESKAARSANNHTAWRFCALSAIDALDVATEMEEAGYFDFTLGDVGALACQAELDNNDDLAAYATVVMEYGVVNHTDSDFLYAVAQVANNI